MLKKLAPISKEHQIKETIKEIERLNRKLGELQSE